MYISSLSTLSSIAAPRVCSSVDFSAGCDATAWILVSISMPSGSTASDVCDISFRSFSRRSAGCERTFTSSSIGPPLPCVLLLRVRLVLRRWMAIIDCVSAWPTPDPECVAYSCFFLRRCSRKAITLRHSSTSGSGTGSIWSGASAHHPHPKHPLTNSV